MACPYYQILSLINMNDSNKIEISHSLVLQVYLQLKKDLGYLGLSAAINKRDTNIINRLIEKWNKHYNYYLERL